MRSTPRVAIVGAGCAGTLTAVNLLRSADGPLDVVLIERSGTFGPGVAYSTRDPRHLLNVPAERMSAFAEEPGDFAAWAARRIGPLATGAYLPRTEFGRYLSDLLDEAEREAAPVRSLERVVGEAVDVALAGGSAEVVLSDGRRFGCDRVVLALGSLPGVPPVSLPDDPRIVENPWVPGALEGGSAHDVTLVVGTGLTGVDTALTLCGSGERGRVIALSRGGCFPCAHLPGLRQPAPAPPLPEAPASLRTLEHWFLGHVRHMTDEGYDWRDVVDGLRPHATTLWRTMPLHERRRFLRERARAWELRRHRMAPAVAERVQELRNDGRLLLRAGQILAARATPSAIEVVVAPSHGSREGESSRTLRVSRVVVCTGAGADVARAESPLLRALLRRGAISPDALGYGLRATPAGALLAADGRPQQRLHVLGPLRRGELWETTAVGEIRQQASVVARAVTGSLARV